MHGNHLAVRNVKYLDMTIRIVCLRRKRGNNGRWDYMKKQDNTIGNPSGAYEKRDTSRKDSNETQEEKWDKTKRKSTMNKSNGKGSVEKEKNKEVMKDTSTYNRYTLHNELVGEDELIPPTDQRKIVDEYMNQENEVCDKESLGWNKEMKKYYKYIKELFDAAKELELEEDVKNRMQDDGEFGLRNEANGEDGNIHAKVEWLNDGDINTKFFHKIIKGRIHKGRVMSVCNEKGETFENEKVAEQFVKHFQEFIGKKDMVTNFPIDKIIFFELLSIKEADRICRDVDEEREGYFSGGRGLRQGDPMSPYLLTLVMKVFNIIMRKNIGENKDFKCHHRCRKLEITHLCFDNDLLVFCHGDTKSCQGELTKGTAKVSWDNICKPKEQGGLGIKNLQDGMKDATVWVDKNGEEKPFSVKNVWKDMECDDANVDWCKVVWFNRNIPMHVFLLWMALQNRLSTQNRIDV
nr:RNA-directed DNA polymerase, eukaryota, reverse transcriptase zinc-binding domain protein [Tanacetum cinerariifolium]GEZ38863.1 RNA-directed DNA polymerase, eukaryota, reverse transcriptase zinc-binding domain protein [Tanacetum cinerariifolium]